MTAKTELLDLINGMLVQYPQYKGHFDHWVLGEIKKDVRTKFGKAFIKGEIVLVEPGTRRFVDMNGKNREMVTAFSVSDRISTSINRKDMVFL